MENACQWVLTYDSSAFKHAYIRVSKKLGVSGVRELERATIFSSEYKNEMELEVFAACLDQGLTNPQWHPVCIQIK